MRLFIAVSVDERVRAAASQIIAGLIKSGADVKWVASENLHLTLSFLGETAEERLPEISRASETAVSGHSPFDLEFDRLGAFGAPARPKVLWLGVGRGAQVLSKLAGALRCELKKTAIAPQEEPGREFSAHLTLGRVRGPKNIKSLVEALKTLKIPPGLVCRAEKLVLYQSRLSTQGPAYGIVRETPLG
ncbi:MAG: RNA 2',3'-cyclic phosphodiesterase [Elusimicrobia bacterium]|nr:RNA 2',3'-cyclic phosphodiesterase [Elusimicrobiota bacterium]